MKKKIKVESSKYNAERTDGLISLKKVLAKSNEELRNKWCEQLLYKTYIIHNEFENVNYDVCLDNLKVDSENNLVITNVPDKTDFDTEALTDVRFKAPELINCSKRSKAGGVWATGICVFYIKNLCFPWKSAVKSDENYCLWANKGIFSCSMSNSNLRILKQMLCVDQEKRPSIENIIKSSFHNEVDAIALSKFIYFIAKNVLYVNIKCFYNH